MAEGDRPEATIRIADEAVATVAAVAATGVEGVAGLSAGLVGDLSSTLGRRGGPRGVRVEVGEREAAVDLYLVVRYGVRIPEVAHRVQQAVKKAVEEMTDLKVVEVNIHVQGVVFPPVQKPEREGSP
ncbi:MAG: Asp23/Gls24 family envelope stress response protein [Bacillota bacterium]|nr:Asp23/Gls24 family envelope stress response protein [Bacillota bacterium]MDI7248490.1 Asp23/Gls24 family envelope stress response protein [Bacillota bacterium]